MIDVLVAMVNNPNKDEKLSLWTRAQRRLAAKGLLYYKRIKPKLPGSHNLPEFQKHRFPGITLEALNQKIVRIQNVLQDTTRLKVDQLSDVLFQISV